MKLVLGIAFLAIAAVVVSAQEDYLKKLHNELIVKRQYDKRIRPVSDWKKPVDTSVSFSLTQVKEISAKDSRITLDGWLYMSWQADSLTWTPIDFGGITEIRVPIEELWTPDITLYNSADVSGVLSRTANTHAIVYSSGKIIWVPPVTYMALCTINLRAYPYDTQVCNITLGSWTFQDSNVNTTIDKKGLFEREAGDYSEWDVAGNRSFRFAKTYECCKGQFYTSIVLELTLKRRPSGVFCYAVILPQAVAFLLTLLQFWVPAKYIKTRFIALTVAIALSFATIHFIVGQLGSLTSGTPYSVRCSGVLMILAALGAVITVVVNRLSRRTQSTELPTSVTKSTNGTLGRLLCLSNSNSSDSDSKKQLESGGDQWTLVGELIDRSAFVVFLIAGLATHLF